MEILTETSYPEFINQLHRVNEKLPGYIGLGTLVPDPTRVAQAISDEQRFAWIELGDQQVHEYAEAWARQKRQLFVGSAEGLPLGDVPLPPTFTVAPAPVPENVLGRTRKFYKYLSTLPGFTQTIGEDLGIIKPQTEINLENVLPVLKVRIATGGHPLLHVPKLHYDGFEVLKAIKGQNVPPAQQLVQGIHTSLFTKLDTSMRADYLDHTPLPSPSEVWIYRVQYVYKGQPVGLISAPVEVAVFNIDLILTQN